MLGKCQSPSSAILVVAVLFSFLVFFVVNCCCCCLSLDILNKSKVKQDTKKKTKKKLTVLTGKIVKVITNVH